MTNLMHCRNILSQKISRRKMRYTWAWEHAPVAPNPSVVTIEFKAVAGGTEVVLSHEGFGSADECGHHTQGWIGVLNSFEKLFN